MTGSLQVAEREKMSGTLIGVLVQEPADRRAGLAWLANKGTQSTCQHSLCGPVATDDIEAPPKWTVECCRDYPPASGEMGD